MLLAILLVILLGAIRLFDLRVELGLLHISRV